MEKVIENAVNGRGIELLLDANKISKEEAVSETEKASKKIHEENFYLMKKVFDERFAPAVNSEDLLYQGLIKSAYTILNAYESIIQTGPHILREFAAVLCMTLLSGGNGIIAAITELTNLFDEREKI